MRCMVAIFEGSCLSSFWVRTSWCSLAFRQQIFRLLAVVNSSHGHANASSPAGGDVLPQMLFDGASSKRIGHRQRSHTIMNLKYRYSGIDLLVMICSHRMHLPYRRCTACESCPERIVHQRVGLFVHGLQGFRPRTPRLVRKVLST